MSSTRNKRKRAENDLTQPTRRRTRDVREEVVPAPISQKNEADEANSNPPESTSAADPATIQTSPSNKGTPIMLKDDENTKIAPPVADTGAGPSQNASPKGPLHVENAEPSNTSTEDPNPDSRASKIQGLITHRTILLSRLRLCRNAAEKRLSVTKMGEMPDEQEIQTHLQVSKLASQVARKARGEDTPAEEKRTSLSLRRGSGVGKRMNAALSSLAPGAGITIGAPPAIPVLANSGESVVNTFLSKPPATGVAPTVFNPSTIRGGAPSADPATPQTFPTSTAPKAAASAFVRSASVGQIRPNAGKAPKSNSTASSAPRTNVPSKDPLRPRIPQSRTVFAEAMVLRKKREAVEGKLRILLARQMAQQGSPDYLMRRKPIDALEQPPKAELPMRRKTHWDRLLQEMNWMATDFIEERKWKASAGSTVSSALRSSDFAFGKRATKPCTPEPSIKVDKQEEKREEKREEKVSRRKSRPVSAAGELKYVGSSGEERQQAKKIASLISTMVSELASAIRESNDVVSTAKSHAEALDRYKKVRDKLLDDALPSTAQRASENASPTNDESNPQCGDVMPEEHDDSGQMNGCKEITFSDISRRLQSLGLPNASKDKFPYKELSHATASKKFSLSEDQQKMVEFVDKVWCSSVGAALSGSPTSGKTVAACSLLWKHRVDGPQLVICPPTALLRWKYELCLFHDMRAINFGPTGGIGCSLKICADDLAVHSDDVVICEFSSVDQLLAIAAKKKIKFQTLIIDCRHPAGMFGSFGSQRQVPEGKTEWHGYDELLSTEWWGKLVWLQNPRRLTLDYCDPDLYSLQSSGLGRRQQLEVLSLRSALLLGPQNFRPSAYPLERTIISWARHQGKKPGEDKFERVRRVLQERLAAFSLATTESLAPSHTTWHIRKCEMPGAQRDAYDSCCSYVRGALSSTLGAANTQDGLGLSTYSAAAAALFRLRQICLGASGIPGKSRGCSSFLAAKYEAYGTAFTPVDVGSFSLAPGQGSQPSAEVAELLLSSSGKFVELLSILRHDCGISFDCDPSLMQRIPNRNGVTPKVASKVAILASLPRTQMLVAALLSALGISHKLMRREAIHVANDSLLFGRHDPSRLTALSWAEAQTSLLSFNMEDAMRDTLRLYGCADVIILSPDALASWHGGIGIDRADVVITVDEDWSGRELGTLKAALARWSVSRTLRKASTKMIRLISKDTIEQKLFNFQENHLSDFWPLDRFGNHLLSLFEVQALSPIYKVALDKSLSQLPGMQILRMRGEPLDSILVSTTQLAPSLDGSKMTFLPFVDLGQSEVELRKGLELLKTLYRQEIMETSKLLASTYGSDEGVAALPQLQTLGAEIRFLSPRIMPSPTILACSDLAFLSARVVLERQVAAARSCSPPLSQRVSVTRFPDLGIKYSAPPKGGINTIGPISTNTITPSTPDQVAEGLLSYKPHFEGSSFKAGPGEAGSNSTRINSYSWAFGTGCDNSGFLNGCQGCEPLVFFPPVLPKVQLAPTIDLQKPDASHTPEGKQPTRLKDGLHAGHAERDIVGQKRQDVEAPFADAEQRSKRPRVESISSGPKSDESSPFFRKNPTKATNGEAFLVSTSQEKVGGATAERGTPSVGSPEVDYGLLGGGVLPLPADTALLLANESVQVNGSSYEFLRGVAPCDNEEHEALANGNSNASLALISLFIKKRHRGLPHRPPGGLPSQLRSDNMTALASTQDINVDEPGKKFKKKPGSQVAQSAFTHVSLLGQSRPGIVPSTVTANSGDEPKRRMLATYVSRQYGTGLTMFESASFRIANIQVHNRVKARIDRELSKAFLSGEAGAGLPTFALNRPRLNAELEQGVIHFAQEVQQLEVGSHTGDAARATATAQFSALSRSHSSPSRVDFGPFGSGFLSSTTGMAGLSPTRSRLGVSLPMGVKLAHSSHEQKQPSWSQEDDALLKAAVIRFGMNWIIIARALSGLQGFLIGSDGASIIRRMAPSSRSSRQCRDRWQSLLRTQPSLASEVRKSEQKLREVHLQELNGETVRSYAAVAAAHQENAILLTHASLFVEDTHEPSLPKANESRSESSRTKPFVTLKASMVKRQVIPLTLPGILPGGQPNQPVPSHPSHMQSVQSSVAAQWSNGRTELWPLQILDCADKHRAATIASAQRAATSEIKVAPSSGREVAVSSNRSSASTAVTSAHMSTTGPPRVQRLPAAPMAGVNVHGPGSSAPPAVQKTPNTSIPKTPNTSNNSA